MYVVFEYLTVLALIAVAVTLLFAGSVVLVALGQGINAIWRIARKPAEPVMVQEIAGAP